MGDGSCQLCCIFVGYFTNFAHIADLSLSQKLSEELKYEQEANAEAEEPEFLTAFKKRGVWEVREYWLYRLPVY